jgi:hypothetical protein
MERGFTTAYVSHVFGHTNPLYKLVILTIMQPTQYKHYKNKYENEDSYGFTK